MNILIDTNVIIDFLLEREPQIFKASEIFELIRLDKIKAFTTASSITDIFYITAKRLGKNQARYLIRQLLRLLDIISVDGNDCVEALDLPIDDYEDSLVLTCSRKVNVDYIISGDADFLQVKSPYAQIITSDDFLLLMSK